MKYAIALAIGILVVWHNIESDIKTACKGNQACLAASL